MTTLVIDDRHTVRSGLDDAPLVLLLHGYGSNELDLPGLIPHLRPGLAAASVRAPLTLGEGSHAWVPIRVPGRPDPAATAEATLALLAWFDEFVAPERQVILLGFSQGGLMVSQLLRHRPDRFVAGLVLSGFVLDATLPGDEVLLARDVPVFFGHGDADPIIAPDATVRASVWLAAHSDLTDKNYPGLQHAVSAEELADINEFLSTHLS
ncbi:alpha/beta hydrolase [Aeromicrobium sp. P5_D10]